MKPLRETICCRRQVPGPHCYNNLFLLRAYDAAVVYFAPTYMQMNWTVMYSKLCTLPLSQAETGAREAKNKDTTAQRANSSTVGCSMAQGSDKHLLNVLRSQTEPIAREKHSPWSVCPLPISGQLLMTAAGFHVPPSCRRDWLSLFQGRGCRELQQQ